MAHRKCLLLFLAGLTALTLSCKDTVVSEGKPLAKVNDYVITEGNFRRELSASAWFHDIVGLTLEDKKDFLNGQIKKELLIQRALSGNLDKREEFRQTIEDYWEKTLITALLREQSSRLEKEIIVTRGEIEARYRELSASDSPAPPPDELVSRLEKEIREEKKTEALDRWIKILWKDADIKLYEENLKAVR